MQLMAEQDLIRFLDKITQLQALVDLIERNPSQREELARCADHNAVVHLAKSWGFDIGRRWGESDPVTSLMDNLLREDCPPFGTESSRLIASGDAWKLVLIASNGFSTPGNSWIEQTDHEWVLLLRGSARLILREPELSVDLSPGDHLTISPHRPHRVDRTDCDPGTLWLALHWLA